MSLIQPLDSTDPKASIVLGAPFMRKFATVFDRDNLSVGLGLAKHDPWRHEEDKKTWVIPQDGLL